MGRIAGGIMMTVLGAMYLYFPIFGTKILSGAA
jgi:hypothetical protein